MVKIGEKLYGLGGRPNWKKEIYRKTCMRWRMDLMRLLEKYFWWLVRAHVSPISGEFWLEFSHRGILDQLVVFEFAQHYQEVIDVDKCVVTKRKLCNDWFSFMEIYPTIILPLMLWCHVRNIGDKYYWTMYPYYLHSALFIETTLQFFSEKHTIYKS